ncbi:hypothetical protein G9F72_004525 [Clostridium estertheticum]|uniref:hypothetical protein n=1 Tax=Clostridium estertheticum TaxID=238834 RepID=UPI0013E94715|nr:hypothetical protein [Clostridium estertheticum]MBZ9685617.1 hypothetical protein [Clostridium estertheticum]
MEIVEIIIIVIFVTILVIALILQYLITTNKIKPSKLSRQFWNDDENFIKSWKKTQQKGMLRYYLENIIIKTFIMGIISIIFLWNTFSVSGYEQRQILVVAMLISDGIYCLITPLIEWGKYQNRYDKLKEKENVESNNIDNDNKVN